MQKKKNKDLFVVVFQRNSVLMVVPWHVKFCSIVGRSNSGVTSRGGRGVTSLNGTALTDLLIALTYYQQDFDRCL